MVIDRSDFLKFSVLVDTRYLKNESVEFWGWSVRTKFLTF